MDAADGSRLNLANCNVRQRLLQLAAAIANQRQLRIATPFSPLSATEAGLLMAPCAHTSGVAAKRDDSGRLRRTAARRRASRRLKLPDALRSELSNDVRASEILSSAFVHFEVTGG